MNHLASFCVFLFCFFSWSSDIKTIEFTCPENAEITKAHFSPLGNYILSVFCLLGRHNQETLEIRDLEGGLLFQKTWEGEVLSAMNVEENLLAVLVSSKNLYLFMKTEPGQIPVNYSVHLPDLFDIIQMKFIGQYEMVLKSTKETYSLNLKARKLMKIAPEPEPQYPPHIHIPEEFGKRYLGTNSKQTWVFHTDSESKELLLFSLDPSVPNQKIDSINPCGGMDFSPDGEKLLYVKCLVYPDNQVHTDIYLRHIRNETSQLIHSRMGKYADYLHDVAFKETQFHPIRNDIVLSFVEMRTEPYKTQGYLHFLPH